MTTETVTDRDFTCWERLLAGERLAIDANIPWTGYYKTRGRSGRFLPVAFWYAQGNLRCRVENVEVEAQRALEIWPYAAKAPVRYEDYLARIETGKWPGESDAVLNHNAAPAIDSVEAIAERIEDLGREATKLIEGGAAQSDAICDQASDLANTFGELEKKADALRVAEKEPHAAAARAVDGKWNPLRDRAAELKSRLKALVITPFLTRKKQETEDAARAAIAGGKPIELINAPKITAGSSKRSTALRTVYRAEIEDHAKLLDHLKEHPDVIAAVQKIANAAAQKKIALPGVKIISEQRAA